MKSFESKYKCIFFTEIILNHTSYDSEWLLDNPDSFYNLENTPQLGSAYALDDAMYQFSINLAQGLIPEYKDTYVRNEDELNYLMKIIVENVILPLKLHEYFLFDVSKVITNFKEFMSKNHPNHVIQEKYHEKEEDICNIFKEEKIFLLEEVVENSLTYFGSSNHGVQIDLSIVSSFFINNLDTTSIDQLENCLKRLNIKNEKIAREYIQEAIGNIRGDIYYNKLEKGHQITLVEYLIHPYFGTLNNGKIAARNGWLFKGDPTEEFASSYNFHYLRRNLVIWGDLVKLNYGHSKKHCPTLWKRMKHYVEEMAEISHGLRIDNAHSTPIHVAEYLVRKARKINPNLYVFCELFSGSKAKDAIYTKRIGVNALLREASQVIYLSN